jgi:hypothetical protein
LLRSYGFLLSFSLVFFSFCLFGFSLFPPLFILLCLGFLKCYSVCLFCCFVCSCYLILIFRDKRESNQSYNNVSLI